MRLSIWMSAAFLLFAPAVGSAQFTASGSSFTVSPETLDAARQITGDRTISGKVHA